MSYSRAGSPVRDKNEPHVRSELQAWSSLISRMRAKCSRFALKSASHNLKINDESHANNFFI